MDETLRRKAVRCYSDTHSVESYRRLNVLAPQLDGCRAPRGSVNTLFPTFSGELLLGRWLNSPDRDLERRLDSLVQLPRVQRQLD